MTNAEFQTASLGQIAALSGIDRHRWSRYLTGKVSITESTLTKAATKLGMTPIELLAAIIQRKQSYLLPNIGERVTFAPRLSGILRE